MENSKSVADYVIISQVILKSYLRVERLSWPKTPKQKFNLGFRNHCEIKYSFGSIRDENPVFVAVVWSLVILMFICRTGHFLLQSSQNIIEPSAVSECEDALNQGSMNAAEVFTSLRNKSIVHLFASIGKFLGLEVNTISAFSLKNSYYLMYIWIYNGIHQSVSCM